MLTPPYAATAPTALLDGGVHPVRETRAVDVLKRSLALVVVDERRRLLLVDLEPRPHRRGLVVRALLQRAPAPVANSRDLGRRRLQVVDRAAVPAEPAILQPADTTVSAGTSRFSTRSIFRVAEERLQPFGLRDRPRKPVEQKPVARPPSPSRVSISPSTVSSGTSRPASTSAWASSPSGVSCATASRRMSPVEISGSPSFSASRVPAFPCRLPAVRAARSHRRVPRQSLHQRRPRIRPCFTKPS